MTPKEEDWRTANSQWFNKRVRRSNAIIKLMDHMRMVTTAEVH